jgi:RHH-type transcriptional regulator, rel operon repressor / antitoxin RelB
MCIHKETHHGNLYSTRPRNRAKAYYLREIIEQGIDDMKDYYLAAEVRKDLGLDD